MWRFDQEVVVCVVCVLGHPIAGFYSLWVGGCPAAKLDLRAAFICIVNRPVKNYLFGGNSAVSHASVIFI